MNWGSNKHLKKGHLMMINKKNLLALGLLLAVAQTSAVFTEDEVRELVQSNQQTITELLANAQRTATAQLRAQGQSARQTAQTAVDALRSKAGSAYTAAAGYATPAAQRAAELGKSAVESARSGASVVAGYATPVAHKATEVGARAIELSRTGAANAYNTCKDSAALSGAVIFSSLAAGKNVAIRGGNAVKTKVSAHPYRSAGLAVALTYATIEARNLYKGGVQNTYAAAGYRGLAAGTNWLWSKLPSFRRPAAVAPVVQQELSTQDEQAISNFVGGVMAKVVADNTPSTEESSTVVAQPVQKIGVKLMLETAEGIKIYAMINTEHKIVFFVATNQAGEYVFNQDGLFTSREMLNQQDDVRIAFEYQEDDSVNCVIYQNNEITETIANINKLSAQEFENVLA